MKYARFALVLGLVCLFLGSELVFANGGGGGGEETWQERKFVHHEYVPYINGSETPRVAYRALTATGNHSIALSVGRFSANLKKIRGTEPFRAGGGLREQLVILDGRRLERADAYIFCDFSVKRTRSYVVENHPYRDTHVHIVYYETPVSIAGFGFDAAPTVGSGLGYGEASRLYVTRPFLQSLTGSGFDASLLAPHAEDHGADPQGKKTKFREWKEGSEFHFSYVVELNKNEEEFGFWSLFKPRLTEAVQEANEAAAYYKDKKALEDANRWLNEVWKDADPAAPPPPWMSDLMDGKTVVPADSVKEYRMRYDRTRARTVFAFDAARLDLYFPDLRSVIGLYERTAKELADSGKAEPDAHIPYDYMAASGVGVWTARARDDSYFFVARTDDADSTARWLYGAALRNLHARGESERRSVRGSADEKANRVEILRAVAETGDADLTTHAGRERVFDSIAERIGLKDALSQEHVASSRWTESYLKENPASPWRFFKDTDLYKMIVPWTSLATTYTLLDAPGTAWNRGIRVSAKPTATTAYESAKPFSRSGSMDAPYIDGIPDKYSNGDDFTAERVAKEAKNRGTELDVEISAVYGGANIRYGTANYFPVDLYYADTIRKALENAFGYELPAPDSDEIVDMLYRLYGTPEDAEAKPGSYGLINWNTNAEKKFAELGADDEDVFDFDTTAGLFYEPYVGYGRGCFGWNEKPSVVESYEHR